MRFFKSRNKFFLRNLVVGLVFFGFSFQILAVPQIYAQNQPKPATTSATPTGTPEQYKVTLPNGKTETGKVLGDCPGGLPDPFGVCGAVGGVAGAIVDLPGKLFDFVMSKLMLILGKIIAFVMHIFATVLGLDTSKVCDQSDAANLATCTDSINKIAQIDPLFSPEASIKVNAFNILDNSYSSLYASVPKINGPTEIASVFQNNVLGIGTANAQGQGTKDLGNLIKEVWQKIRDLTYIAMVLILVAIGLMVMLRRRLDPKTVVSATNSLPKVAIALVLITFSFAFAGFFIDIIYLLVGLIRSYFGGLDALDVALKNLGKIAGGELTWLPILTFISRPILNWGVFIVALLPVIPAAMAVGPIAPLILLIPIIAALGFELIIRIGLFILAIMLFWSLVMRFAQMIILTIFSPFFFLIGALPGLEGITMNWFKRMFAITLAFPGILLIAYVALALLSPFDSATWNLFGHGPNDVSAPPPLGAAKNFINIAPLMGLGLLYFATKIPGAIDEVLGIKDTKQKGPTPLILVSGAMGGMKNYAAISKGAPAIGKWAAGLANSPGLTGRIAGGVLPFLRPFSTGNNRLPSPADIKENRAKTLVARKEAANSPSGRQVPPSLFTPRGGSAKPNPEPSLPGFIEEHDASNLVDHPASPTFPGMLNEADYNNAQTPPAPTPAPQKGFLSRFRGTGSNKSQVPPSDPNDDHPNFKKP